MSERLPMAIDCRNLTFRYGHFTAVDDVTLQVRPGETMGLLGPNGAGKTTLVRTLTTLTPVQRGELRILGLDARDQTVDIRSNIGYVPQQLSIEPALTGRQNVQWFARLYGVPRADRAERVDHALEAMELLDVADRLAGTYSGGMVRRLEVAQALVNRPSLLVLDEPTVGLDPIARDGVWAQVQSMQSQFGMTVLLTTHYMEEADALCDRVAIIDHGKLLALGAPDELKTTLGANTVIELELRQSDGIQLLITSLENMAQIKSAEVKSGGLRLFAHETAGLLPEIVHAAQNYGVRDISINEPSLETVFIRLTGRDLRE